MINIFVYFTTRDVSTNSTRCPKYSRELQAHVQLQVCFLVVFLTLDFSLAVNSDGRFFLGITWRCKFCEFTQFLY